MSGWTPLSYGSALRGMSAASAGANRALRELSTGRRINSAADDAAGSAVAMGFESRMRCGAKIDQNVQTGVSILQLAEGGLGTVSNLLVRARELAMQSASDGIGDQERSYLQIEMDQLLREIDHTACTTQWNDESPIAAVHADVGFVLDVSGSMSGEIAAVRAALTNFRAACVYSGVDVAFGFASVGDDRDDQTHLQVDIGEPDFDSQLATISLSGWAQDPYSALIQTSGAVELPGGGWEPDAFTWRQNSTRHIIQVTDTGRETDVIPDSIPDDESSVASMVASQGVAVHVIAPSSRHDVFDGIAAGTGGSIQDIGPSNGSGVSEAMDRIAELIAARGEERTPLEIITGYGSGDKVEVGQPFDATATGLGLSNVDVSTKSGALDALNRIDSAIDQVSAGRASFGAETRRLQSILDQNARANESLASSKMHIEDTDIAQSSAALLRQQVLGQAGQQVMSRIHNLNRNLLLTLIS